MCDQGVVPASDGGTVSDDRRPLLAIVPARGGSRGIIGKNLAMIAGKPMLLHTLETLRAVDGVDRLVVSTEDPAIAGYARLRGFEVLPRPADLSSADTTLSQVAVAIAHQLQWDGDVGVFQPTSPLRTTASVVTALKTFRESGVDSLSSVVREPATFWYDEHGDLTGARPLFAERVNRQYAHHRVLRETGSVQLVKVEALLAGGQLVTDNHLVFETDADEGIDVDTLDDLARVRRIAERGLVVFRLRANRRIGLGHLYHCLALAEELQSHDVHFLLADCDEAVTSLVAHAGWPHDEEQDLARQLASLGSEQARVLVNDVLDTGPADVLPALQLGWRVVNIEDLGEGARLADLVVNALYAPDSNLPHALTGAPYTTLRTEFAALPAKEIRTAPQRVLVTFGGADPAGLTRRIGGALASALDVEVRLLLGPACDPLDVAGAVVVPTSSDMAAEMMAADLIVTSAGRTVYEAAATGTPVVVVAQNSREATHAHLSMDLGVVYLGLGPLVDEEHVVQVVRRLLDDASLRADLSARLRAGVDAGGARRVARHIEAMLRNLT